MPWEEDTIKVDEIGLVDVKGLVVIIARLGASIRAASFGRLRLQAF
jgi:galactose-1-phosphate uridylyltransferase